MGRSEGNNEASPKTFGGLNKNPSFCSTAIALVFLTKIKIVIILTK